jgi:hypothetical protein
MEQSQLPSSSQTFPGDIIAQPVHSIVGREYKRAFGSSYTEKCYWSQLNKKDTYITIFGPGQDYLMEILEKEKNINILFKGPKAMNIGYRNSYNDHLNRNTVVIYERKK